MYDSARSTEVLISIPGKEPTVSGGPCAKALAALPISNRATMYQRRDFIVTAYLTL